MASLKMLKQIAEHSMEHCEIPWDQEDLLELIDRQGVIYAKDCDDEISDYEQAYQETQDALYEVEEALLTMYKIRMLYERYLAIKNVTAQEVE